MRNPHRNRSHESQIIENIYRASQWKKQEKNFHGLEMNTVWILLFCIFIEQTRLFYSLQYEGWCQCCWLDKFDDAITLTGFFKNHPSQMELGELPKIFLFGISEWWLRKRLMLELQSVELLSIQSIELLLSMIVQRSSEMLIIADMNRVTKFI